MHIQVFIYLITLIVATHGYLYPDYFWRLWDGKIPDDAFVSRNPGIKDTYIAQKIEGSNILPIFFVSDEDTQKELTNMKKLSSLKNDSYVMILCSKLSYNFRWIKTNKDKLRLMTKINTIDGGFSGSNSASIAYCENESYNVLIDAAKDIGVPCKTFHILTYGGLSAASYMKMIKKPNDIVYSEGFYWRDYSWSIPGDAVVGGRDYDFSEMFVGGSFVHPDKFIPRSIRLNEHEILTPIDTMPLVYAKVLCSGDPKKLKWIMMDKANLSKIENCVKPSGVEGGNRVYIGRAYYNGKVELGVLRGNVFTLMGDEVPTYEILTYDCPYSS